MTVFERYADPAACIARGIPYAEFLHADRGGSIETRRAALVRLDAGEDVRAVYAAAFGAGAIVRLGIGTEDACAFSEVIALDLSEETEVRFEISFPRPEFLRPSPNPLARMLAGGSPTNAAVGGAEVRFLQDGAKTRIVFPSAGSVFAEGELCGEAPLLPADAGGNVETSFPPIEADASPVAVGGAEAVTLFSEVGSDGTTYERTEFRFSGENGEERAYRILFADTAEGRPYLVTACGVELPYEGTRFDCDAASLRKFCARVQKGALRFFLLDETGLRVYGRDGALLFSKQGDYDRLVVGDRAALVHRGEQALLLGADLVPRENPFFSFLLGNGASEERFTGPLFAAFDPESGTGATIDLERGETGSFEIPPGSDTDGVTAAYPSEDKSALCVRTIESGAETRIPCAVGRIERVRLCGRGVLVFGTEGSALCPARRYRLFPGGEPIRLSSDGVRSVSFDWRTVK